MLCLKIVGIMVDYLSRFYFVLRAFGCILFVGALLRGASLFAWVLSWVAVFFMLGYF